METCWKSDVGAGGELRARAGTDRPKPLELAAGGDRWRLHVMTIASISVEFAGWREAALRHKCCNPPTRLPAANHEPSSGCTEGHPGDSRLDAAAVRSWVWLNSIVRVSVGAACLSLALAPIVVACGGSEAEREAKGSGKRSETRALDKIAFTVNRRGWNEVWVMDADGRNRIRLTEPPPPRVDAQGSAGPAWSPDGTLIVYTSTGEAVEEDERDVEIYLMRADGSAKRRLTNDRALDSAPAWSPDGKKIAFAHYPGQPGRARDAVLMVMDADGRERRQITRDREVREIVIDTFPAWSPDGTQIAFSRTRWAPDGDVQGGLYLIESDGSDERMLIEDGFDPEWSPDGRRIVFSSTKDRYGETCFHECSPSSEIYVAWADGTSVRRLTKNEASDQSPTWAPDGKRIAFTSDRADRRGHAYEIYVIGADGKGLRRLTRNNVWDSGPDWR